MRHLFSGRSGSAGEPRQRRVRIPGVAAGNPDTGLAPWRQRIWDQWLRTPIPRRQRFAMPIGSGRESFGARRLRDAAYPALDAQAACRRYP